MQLFIHDMTAVTNTCRFVIHHGAAVSVALHIQTQALGMEDVPIELYVCL